jgi:single-strand DNA-binding protein
MCNFNIAVDDTFSKTDRADFIRVVVFGVQAENCKKYLRKGFLAGVSGRLRSSSYTDADGVKRYPIDVTAERVQFLQWPDRDEKKETGTEDVTPAETPAASSNAAIEPTDNSEMEEERSSL